MAASVVVVLVVCRGIVAQVVGAVVSLDMDVDVVHIAIVDIEIGGLLDVTVGTGMRGYGCKSDELSGVDVADRWDV